MRVAEISQYYPPQTGGTENHVRRCSLGLASDHEVYVLTSNTTTETVHERKEGIPVVRAARVGEFASQSLTPTLPYHLWRLNPDLVHLHAPNPLALFSYLLVTPRTPLVITHHGDIVQQQWAKHFYLPFYRHVLRRAKAIILFTERYGRTSPELQHVQDKIEVIPHGTKEEIFEKTERVEKEASHLRKEYTNGAPAVTFIGRVVHWKGIHCLLQAIANLPKVHAFIGGDGAALEENKQIARDLGISSRVHFLGHLNDKEKVPVFYAGDVFVLPPLTRNESFGIVQVEAQLCRRPVVVSEIGGAPEVTVDGRTGLTVPPGNVNALVTSIGKLMEDDSLRKRLGENGYRRAKEQYVEAVTMPKLRRLFADLE